MGKHDVRKYITYRNAAIGGPSHGRRQQKQGILLNSAKFECVVFEIRERADSHKNRHISVYENTLTYHVNVRIIQRDCHRCLM